MEKTEPRKPVDPLMRIETARLEIGQTEVGPSVARSLVTAFLVTLSLPLVAQIVFEPSLLTTIATTIGKGLTAGTLPVSSSVLGPIIDRNRTLLASVQTVDDLVADDSLVTGLLRPPVQLALSSGLGAGTSQVHHGRGRWLFYAPDLAYVTGPGFLEPRQLRQRAAQGDSVVTPPQPDPRPVLFDLHTQLAERDIALVVMPTPVKPSVDWRFLDHRRRISEHLPTNASYRALVDELRQGGLLVFDVADELANDPANGLASERQTTNNLDDPRYLATDTHWRPETVELVAARLAAFLSEHTPVEDERISSYRASRVSVTNHGDTARLLGLPPQWSTFGPETVTPRRITGDGDTPWRPEPTSDVLLLGDSFTNVYSLEAMGWGTSAGLAEQLSFTLQRPVDRISQNDDGAFASRQLLADELSRGHGRLDGKRVVILQFAARELGLGDWRRVDLTTAPRPTRPSFIRPTGDQTLDVQGTIRDIGRIPRPGSVPYKDHIVAVHVTDVTVETTTDAVDGTELVVYLWSMQDDDPTPVSRYRVGDAIRLRLEPWANVAGELDGINRDEVDDPAARLVEPWWGQLQSEGSP